MDFLGRRESFQIILVDDLFFVVVDEVLFQRFQSFSPRYLADDRG